MNRSAWLTLTTQCERLQDLTLRFLRIPPLTKHGLGRNAAFMSTKDAIINKLREAFLPESLDVTDESHLHEGHAGHRPGGETHFRVYIVSPSFEGKSRVDRHRMINAALAAELAGSVRKLRGKSAPSGTRWTETVCLFSSM